MSSPAGDVFSPGADRRLLLLETISRMSRPETAGALLLAAMMEAGGDALVRMGLRQHTTGMRGLAFTGGALVLFGYGLLVNAPDWDFGRLLGLYVVLFFVIAQIVSWVVFHQPPSLTTIIGGALILAGGLVLGIGRV